MTAGANYQVVPQSRRPRNRSRRYATDRVRPQRTYKPGDKLGINLRARGQASNRLREPKSVDIHIVADNKNVPQGAAQLSAKISTGPAISTISSFNFPPKSKTAPKSSSISRMELSRPSLCKPFRLSRRQGPSTSTPKVATWWPASPIAFTIGCARPKAIMPNRKVTSSSSPARPSFMIPRLGRAWVFSRSRLIPLKLTPRALPARRVSPRLSTRSQAWASSVRE